MQKIFEKRCVICNTHNVARGIEMSQVSQTAQMDFIELFPCEGKENGLVFVDMWSKWVEVFPMSKQDAAAVVRALLTEIVPRWEISTKKQVQTMKHILCRGNKNLIG